MAKKPKKPSRPTVAVIGESVFVVLPEDSFIFGVKYDPRFQIQVGLMMAHTESGEQAIEVMLMNGPRDDTGPVFTEESVEWEKKLMEDVSSTLKSARKKRDEKFTFPIDLYDAVTSSGSLSHSHYETAGQIWLANFIATHYRFKATMTPIGGDKHIIELSVDENSDNDEPGVFTFTFRPDEEPNTLLEASDYDGYFGYMPEAV